MSALRDYQERGIADLRSALRSGYKRPLLQLPTGAGKTKTAAAIINSAYDKGKRVIFTVPAVALIDQTVRAFWDENIRDIGVIQANHSMTNPAKPVQIASVQTLQKRAIPEADLVIIDEAHKVFNFVTDWMGQEAWADKPFIGLSATPWTKGLGRLFDKLVVVTTMAELIDQGHLAPFRVFAPSHPDLSGVKTIAGDYHEGQLAEVMDHLVADVVKTWQQLGEGRPTFCFAVDRAHARRLTDEFRASGVAAEYMDALTTSLDRESIRKRFRAGETRVVCNVGVLTTGVDWDVRCISLARPTKSEILYVQMIGRGLRPAEGKDHCLILDHSDTTLRMGFVSDIQRDRLDGGTLAGPQKERAARELPTECLRCRMVKGPGPCPGCGFKPVHNGAEVKVEDGQLVEMDAGKAARDNRNAEWSEKISFYRQLLAHAAMTGKKSGWAAHKYRAKYSVWPNDQRLKQARPAAAVSPEVRSWIKSQDIRFAKSKARPMEYVD